MIQDILRQFNYVKVPTKKEAAYLVLFYNSWTMYYLLEIIHKEFLIKSTGAADSLGIKWKPLSEKRRIYKPLQRGELTSSVRRKLSGGRSTKKQLLADRNPPINIDTKRLLNSLKPGRVTGGMYKPPNSDQRATITLDNISLDIRVPYSDDVQAVRPFIPVQLTRWMRQAQKKALKKLGQELLKLGFVK